MGIKVHRVFASHFGKRQKPPQAERLRFNISGFSIKK